MGDDFRYHLQKNSKNIMELNEKVKTAVICDINARLNEQNSDIKFFFNRKNCKLELNLSLSNRLLIEEKSYSMKMMQQENDSIKLRKDQAYIFSEIKLSLSSNKCVSNCFFIEGPGGCGKTTLYTYLLNYHRLKGKIALSVASSGIAAILLPGGRTAHSRFKIPLDITNVST